jgi:integrase
MGKTVASAGPAPGGYSFTLYAGDGGRKYLNLGERQRLLDAIPSLDCDKALLALTLLWTGARVSEVLALTPVSFQLDEGLVAISTLKRRRFVVRELPLPDELIEGFDAHFDLRGRQRDPQLRSRPLWACHRTTVWRLMKALMVQSDVIGRAACPRGLRHSFGVGTLQAGVPLSLVQRWLGHAQIRTTAIYADVSGPEERSFAERFWRDGNTPSVKPLAAHPNT